MIDTKRPAADKTSARSMQEYEMLVRVADASEDGVDVDARISQVMARSS